MKFNVTQFDVKTAFLNGTLEEEVYMEISEGFEAEGDMVCRLHKSLYGLKQSPRLWTLKLKEVLAKYGLRAIISDPCVFMKEDPDRLLLRGRRTHLLQERERERRRS